MFIRRFTNHCDNKESSIPSMDSPFFRSRWNAPSHPRYYSPGGRTVPVQNQTVHPPKAVSRSPRVVSIPVQYVEPERDRSGSALRIQKVFRGFLVRKSVRWILALRREVEEIERRVSDPEEVELIRREPREKLRVSEMLMNVLFRLDSVRGVDSGVRECRKAVIKKAIALQEMVDEIVSAGRAAEDDGRHDDGGTTTEEVAKVDDSGPEAVRVEADSPQGLGGAEGDVEFRGNAERRMDDLAVESSEADHVDGGGDDCDHKMIEERAGGEEVEMCYRENDERVEENDQVNTKDTAEDGAEDGLIPSMGECSGETQAESQTDSTSLIEGIEENGLSMDSEAEEEKVEHCGCDGKKEEGEGGEGGRGGEMGRRRNEELLEKMVEDNRKMMGLMAELLERNERQNRLLSSLSQRVENLERAFVCEKLRRKKKRNAGGCSGTSPGTRKCGMK